MHLVLFKFLLLSNSYCVFLVPDLTSSKSEKDDPNDADNDADAEDDEVRFKASEESSRAAVSPRWSTRVFAAESLQRIIYACEGNNSHFDLALARENKIKNNRGKNMDWFMFIFQVLCYFHYSIALV